MFGVLGKQRNYRFFLLFVFCTTVLDLYVDGWCWGYLAKLASENDMGWWEAIHHGVSGPAALALIIYTLLALGWAPLQIHWLLTCKTDGRSCSRQQLMII